MYVYRNGFEEEKVCCITPRRRRCLTVSRQFSALCVLQTMSNITLSIHELTCPSFLQPARRAFRWLASLQRQSLKKFLSFWMSCMKFENIVFILISVEIVLFTTLHVWYQVPRIHATTVSFSGSQTWTFYFKTGKRGIRQSLIVMVSIKACSHNGRLACTTALIPRPICKFYPYLSMYLRELEVLQGMSNKGIQVWHMVPCFWWRRNYVDLLSWKPVGYLVYCQRWK